MNDRAIKFRSSWRALLGELTPLSLLGALAMLGCSASYDTSVDDAAAPAEAAAADEDLGQTSQALGVFSALGFPWDVLPVEIMNVNSGKCLDVGNADTASGSNVVQFACTGAKNQTWFLVRTNTGTDYQIRAGHAGSRNLDVAGGGSADNANVQIFDSGSVQKWGVRKQTDGSYEIVAKAADKCLDVAGASTANSANVQQFTCNGGANQHWIIRPRTSELSLIARHSGKCMDVASASTANNANVQQFECANGTNQRWFLQDGGVVGSVQYWSVLAQHSGKCLDVAGASTADNANIQQFQCNGGDNQKWAITTVTSTDGKGYTVLKNKLSGKCIDVAGADTGNNANIQQFTCGASDNQRFYWANFVERHIQVVPVANSSGSGAAVVPDADIQAHVARANAIFQKYGTKLVYTPASDRSAQLNNDALFNYDSSSATIFTCPDGTTGTSLTCATRHAPNFPGKIVVYVRPGSGESWGDRNHIVIGDMQSASTLACGVAPDTQWLAHELGHYMGLAHTHIGTGFANVAAASAWLQSHGNLVSSFEGDLLSDTRPDPFISSNSCLSPSGSTGVVTLTNSSGNAVNVTVDTNNVMGYYYNSNAQITSGQQAPLTRATSYARFF